MLLQKQKSLDCYVQNFPISSGAKETYGADEEDTYMDKTDNKIVNWIIENAAGGNAAKSMMILPDGVVSTREIWFYF